MITVLGATGYTGRLVARELSGAGHDFTLAGRDRARLEALAEAVGANAVQVVDVASGGGSLAEHFRPGEVVINCVGPFAELGDPVVQGCIEAGAHYVDTTGEQPWMRAVHERWHGAAVEAGLSVVNGMAFEYALGDCAANLAAAPLAAPLRSLDVVYAWGGATSSRGTRRTALRILGSRGWVLDHGRWIRRPQGSRRRAVRLASGRRLYGVLFTTGEVVTVPRHVDVDTVRGWAVVGRRVAALVPLVAPLLPFGVRFLRPVLEPLVTRRPDPAPEDRRSSRFTIRVEAVGRDGAARAIDLEGRDPYDLTSLIAVRGARRVLEPDAPRGVIPPAVLIEPRTFLSSLAVRGLRVTAEDHRNGFPTDV